MRLIDADALIEFEEKAWDGSAGEVSPSSLYHIILDDIRDAKTIDAIPVKWLESFKPLMTEDAYWGIKEAISQWNGDYEIIDEARRCIDRAFREVMR